MMRIIGALLALVLCSAEGAAQTYCRDASGVNHIPITSSLCDQLGVEATVNASISGFAPSSNYSTLTAAGASVRAVMPAGSPATIIVYNTGTTAVSCKLGDVTVVATANEDQIQAGSWISYTVGSNTNLACIDQTGSASNVVVMSGGAGIPTGSGGGGGGGGGSVTQGTSPWVVSNGGTFAVQAVLGAESTKVIGTVNEGTIPWVVGQGTASALNAQVVGNVASGSPVAGNPVRIGVSDTTNVRDLLAPIAFGDGQTGNNMLAVGTWMWNGASWDRLTGTAAGGVKVNATVVQATAANLNATVSQATAANLNATIPVLGATNDAECSTPNGTCSLISLTKRNNLDTVGVGTIQGNVNVTPTNCSISATSGAQDLLPTSTTRHGYLITNIDATTGGGEPIWISFTGAAGAAAAGSFPLPAPTAPSYTNAGTFSSPLGFGSNTIVSARVATNGHIISCVYW